MRRHAYRWWCLLAALGAAACGSAEPAAHGGSAEAGHGTMAGHSEAAGVSGSSGADARAGAAGTAGKISAGAGGDVHGGEAGAATHAANGGGASAAMQLGGSGGMAGASAKLQCPSAAPSAGDACQGIGSCTYGERPGCRSVWDCLAGKFALLAGGQCVAAADDRCPMAAPASATLECAAASCIYPDAVVCTCESPCSGMPMPSRFVCQGAARSPCPSGGLPQQGKPCEVEGLFCGSSCCGPRATCTQGVWSVANLGCPP